MGNNLSARNQAKRYIYRRLESNLIPATQINNIPTWKYTDGWSDQEVRQEVQSLCPDTDVTIHLVTGIRSRSWGVLYKEPKKTDAQRIAELEQTVAALLAERENIQPELPFTDSVKEATQTVSATIEDLFSPGRKGVSNADK